MNGLIPGNIIQDIPQQPQNENMAFPNAFNAMFHDDKVKNFISQTSPTDTLERINYILKGFVYDESTKEWVKVSDGVPDKIRLDFLQFITTDLSEDVRMNRFEAKQINGVMESSIEWVLDYLDITSDEYNLEEEQMTKIAWMIIKTIFYAVCRAENGIERHQMYKSINLTGSPDSMPSSRFNQNKKWYEFWK